jgi:protein-tyrosine phosphatase
MIDLHTHILPGVDDGATDLAETLAMLDMAREDGITDVVASPHANLRFQFDPEHCRRERDRIALRCPDGPAVYLGCELHLTPENLDAVILRPELFTINSNGFLLLELPPGALRGIVDACLQRLLNARIRPLIAHPEREHVFQKDGTYARELAGMGVYFQVTAQAINVAQPTCMALLKHRLAHVVASDAHGVKHRRPLLSAAHTKVVQEFGQATADLLFVENPSACLAGQPLACAQPKRSFFSLFQKQRTDSYPQRVTNAPGRLNPQPQLPAESLKAVT